MHMRFITIGNAYHIWMFLQSYYHEDEYNSRKSFVLHSFVFYDLLASYLLQWLFFIFFFNTDCKFFIIWHYCHIWRRVQLHVLQFLPISHDNRAKTCSKVYEYLPPPVQQLRMHVTFECFYKDIIVKKWRRVIIPECVFCFTPLYFVIYKINLLWNLLCFSLFN